MHKKHEKAHKEMKKEHHSHGKVAEKAKIASAHHKPKKHHSRGK